MGNPVGKPKIDFYKYESLGNDFVLVEETQVAGMDWSALAKELCSRRWGIGSDGLLVLNLQDAPYRLRMFNPDGSEDFCGNGLRCAGLHLWRQGWVDKEAVLLHGGESIPVRFDPAGWIDVTLPAPSFDPRRVPLAEGVGEVFERELTVAGHHLRVSALTTGSTHCVLSCSAPPDEAVFRRVSMELENHPWFPQRTSVIWAWDSGPKQISIRIWERGVGETRGCGTGSAAAAACWFRKNPNLLAIGVMNPGGEAVVSKGPEGRLIVSAKARFVFSGNTLSPTQPLSAPQDVP
jgi:diaminopimelate epimerase